MCPFCLSCCKRQAKKIGGLSKYVLVYGRQVGSLRHLRKCPHQLRLRHRSRTYATCNRLRVSYFLITSRIHCVQLMVVPAVIIFLIIIVCSNRILKARLKAGLAFRGKQHSLTLSSLSLPKYIQAFKASSSPHLLFFK